MCLSQKTCGGRVRPCHVFQLLGISSLKLKLLISSLSRSSTSFGMLLDVAQFAAPTQKRRHRKPVGLKYAFIVHLWTEPNLAKWQRLVKWEPAFRTTNPKSLEQCLCKAIGVFLFLPPLFLELIAAVSALGLSFGCEIYHFAKWVASRDRNVLLLLHVHFLVLGFEFSFMGNPAALCTPHSGPAAGLWAFEFLRSTTEYCRTREGAGNLKVIGNGRSWLSLSDQEILIGGVGSISVWINLTWVIGSWVVEFFYPQHLSMKAGTGVWPSLSVEFPRLKTS